MHACLPSPFAFLCALMFVLVWALFVCTICLYKLFSFFVFIVCLHAGVHSLIALFVCIRVHFVRIGRALGMH